MAAISSQNTWNSIHFGLCIIDTTMDNVHWDNVIILFTFASFFGGGHWVPLCGAITMALDPFVSFLVPSYCRICDVVPNWGYLNRKCAISFPFWTLCCSFTFKGRPRRRVRTLATAYLRGYIKDKNNCSYRSCLISTLPHCNLIYIHQPRNLKSQCL